MLSPKMIEAFVATLYDWVLFAWTFLLGLKEQQAAAAAAAASPSSSSFFLPSRREVPKSLGGNCSSGTAGSWHPQQSRSAFE